MPTDIRVMVPRVQRALEGVEQTLTEDQVKFIVADALAEVILFSNGRFGHDLLVTESENEVPTEYATATALTLPEQSVVAAQAAISYLVRELSSLKTSETIRDEGQEWSWQSAASAITERIRELRDMRDRALEAVIAADPVPVSFTSFLRERDLRVANFIEPIGGEPWWRPWSYQT